MNETPIQLTMGPLLFHWAPDRIRDFYSRIADEAPVERVYLGEVVCGKRATADRPRAGGCGGAAGGGRQGGGVVDAGTTRPPTRP